jgi:hypothetical protein
MSKEYYEGYEAAVDEFEQLERAYEKAIDELEYDLALMDLKLRYVSDALRLLNNDLKKCKHGDHTETAAKLLDKALGG